MATITFRVDSSHIIGSGHVMRCLALASELRLLDHLCVFVVYPHAESSKLLIAEAGFTVLELKSSPCAAHDSLDSNTWLVNSESDDAEEFLSMIPEECALTVVDHYAIGSVWHEQVRRRCFVVAIDDLANRPMSPDILINYNFQAGNEEKYKKIIDKMTTLWLGQEYIFLRREFLGKTIEERNRPKNCKNILVFMGGADSSNVTEPVVDALLTVFGNKKNLKVILGDANREKQRLNDKYRGLDNLLLIPTQREMSEIYDWADFAIGGVGVSAYERAAMGLPSIGVIVAENQRPVVASLAQTNCSIFIDHLEQDFQKQLVSFLQSIDSSTLESMSFNGLSYFKNVKGCPYVAEQISKTLELDLQKRRL